MFACSPSVNTCIAEVFASAVYVSTWRRYTLLRMPKATFALAMLPPRAGITVLGASIVMHGVNKALPVCFMWLLAHSKCLLAQPIPCGWSPKRSDRLLKPFLVQAEYLLPFSKGSGRLSICLLLLFVCLLT